MAGRVFGAPGALPAVLFLAGGIALGVGGAAAQQAPPGGAPPSTEQLRQAIEEIKKRLARPGETPGKSPLAAELEAANARIAELGETIARLRAERDGLRDELAAARAEGQRLEQVIRELDARAQALEQRLVELDEGRGRELARLEGEVTARETALAKAREELERESRRRAERENELAGLVNRLGELQGELEASRSRARADAEAQAKRVEELTGRLAAADATAARLESELAELRAIAATSVGELQNLGEQLLRVLADNQALAQALEQARIARELALAEATVARRDSERYAAELAQLRSRLASEERPVEAVAPAAPARLEPRVDGLAAPEPAPEPLSRAQLAELRAAEGPDGTIVTVIEGTAFQFGSEQLTEAANGALLRVGRLIELVRPERVRFVGHTDSQGDEAANRRLSQRRAQAVRDWLVRNRGLDPARTRVEGRGPDQPIAGNDTPEGRRANRRVEVILERRGVER
jgi:outer membrane protein OmpA-like peptidoglycan-associated protein